MANGTLIAAMNMAQVAADEFEIALTCRSALCQRLLLDCSCPTSQRAPGSGDTFPRG
jgi:hypothetical protein